MEVLFQHTAFELEDLLLHGCRHFQLPDQPVPVVSSHEEAGALVIFFLLRLVRVHWQHSVQVLRLLAEHQLVKTYGRPSRYLYRVLVLGGRFRHFRKGGGYFINQDLANLLLVGLLLFDIVDGVLEHELLVVVAHLHLTRHLEVDEAGGFVDVQEDFTVDQPQGFKVLEPRYNKMLVTLRAKGGRERLRTLSLFHLIA